MRGRERGREEGREGMGEMFEGGGGHGREEGRWEKKDVKDLAMCAIWMWLWFKVWGDCVGGL